MTPEESNELRCVASEIITRLFHAKATGQIQLLVMQTHLSAKQLDPKSHREFLKSALATTHAPRPLPKEGK